MVRIVCDPNILVGKPTIEGTRISVELILNLLESGQTIPEIINDYDLNEDQIKAAIAFATKRLREDYPVRKAFAHEVSAGRKHR